MVDDRLVTMQVRYFPVESLSLRTYVCNSYGTQPVRSASSRLVLHSTGVQIAVYWSTT
jgi:hypothetical protein